MRCSLCLRPARPLFTSVVCDYCDGLIDVGKHHGFIVFRGPDDLLHKPVYVFRTRTDAARWRAHYDLRTCPILEVRFELPVRWKLSTGVLAGLELADRPFTISPDHRFEPAPYRGYLLPDRPQRRAA